MKLIDNYKTLGHKEFFARWKQGIEGITPLQQAKGTYNSTWISILGIILGIVVTIIWIKTMWWLLIILVGALGNTLIMQLSNWQKIQLLKKMEDTINNIDNIQEDMNNEKEVIQKDENKIN
jgi:hypothetical protein